MLTVYIGTAHLIFACGLACGGLLGWALTRWYFIRLLRGIQRRVASTVDLFKPFRCGSCGAMTEYRDGYSVPGRAAICPTCAAKIAAPVITELRRRKL